MKQMKQPKKWKELKRHPLSAEYDDLGGRAWELFVANVKTNGLSGRKITLHDGMVLDGWQLQRACAQMDVRPEYQPLPPGWTPEAFVEAANDHRRHETQEQAMRRAHERRQRVAQAHANGQSTRAIAEAEGVTQTQVMRDIKASGETGVSPEAGEGQDTLSGTEKIEKGRVFATSGETGVSPESPARKVKGRDGKTYSARKPKRPASKPAPPPPEPEAPPPAAVDDLGIPVQEHAREAFEAVPQFRELVRLLRQAERMYHELASLPGGVYLQRVSANVSGRWKSRELTTCIHAVEDSRPSLTFCPWEYHEMAFPEKQPPHVHDKSCNLCKGLRWTRPVEMSRAKNEVPQELLDAAKEDLSV
jgi:hypothetical protein